MPYECPLCPHSGSSDNIAAAAASCTSSKVTCANKPTSALRSLLRGVECNNAASVAARGFFIISLAVTGEPVCTGGDRYHVWVTEGDGKTKESKAHFAALSQAVPSQPGVYWVSTSATAALLGSHRYTLAASLVETQRRAGDPHGCGGKVAKMV